MRRDSSGFPRRNAHRVRHSPTAPLWLHVILTLLGRSILVLLVLRDQVVHVALSLSELHLVHALTGVPVQECLAAEHGSEVLRDTLEHLLNGGGVACECHC